MCDADDGVPRVTGASAVRCARSGSGTRASAAAVFGAAGPTCQRRAVALRAKAPQGKTECMHRRPEADCTYIHTSCIHRAQRLDPLSGARWIVSAVEPPRAEPVPERHGLAMRAATRARGGQPADGDLWEPSRPWPPA